MADEAPHADDKPRAEADGKPITGTKRVKGIAPANPTAHSEATARPEKPMPPDEPAAPVAKPVPKPAAKATKAAPSAAPPTDAPMTPPSPMEATGRASAPSAKSAEGSGTRPAPKAASPVPAKPDPPAAPAAPGSAAPAKPAAPASPPTPPTGDHIPLSQAFQGTSFAILEDGCGVTTVAPDDLFTAASWARDQGYTVLSLLSAYDRTDHFGVLYAFLRLAANPAEFGELRLRVTMPKAAGEPACPSLEDLFPAAGWHEREMFDMYGIRFEGNRDLRRMFLPEGWTGYPMRKDNKEPEQFVALREGEDIVVRTNEEGSW